LDSAARLFDVELCPPLSRRAGRSAAFFADRDEDESLLAWERQIIQGAVTAGERPSRAKARGGQRRASRPFSAHQVLTIASTASGLSAEVLAAYRGAKVSAVEQQCARLDVRLDGRSAQDAVGFKLPESWARVVELRVAGVSDADIARRLS